MSNPELDPVTSKTTNTEITSLQKIEGFHKLIDNANTAMLVTRCESGALHSRAMTPCHRTCFRIKRSTIPLTVKQRSRQRKSTCFSLQTMRPTSSTSSSTTPTLMCLFMTRRLPDGRVCLALRRFPRTRTSSRSFGLQCSCIPGHTLCDTFTDYLDLGSRLSSVT